MTKPLLAALALLCSPLLLASPITPTPINTPQWIARHEGFLQARPDAQIVFVGDSITDLWAQQGREVWRERIAPLAAVNFGIGGDRIENVHWRVLNGELKRLAPRVIVLLIGTNNLTRNSVDEIVEGYRALVAEIMSSAPSSKLILMNILPRADAWVGDSIHKIAPVNEQITRLAAELKASGSPVERLDLERQLLSEDGTLSKEIAYDGLHLTDQGYRIWADAITPLLVQE